jgi:hypothetical protein
MPYRQITRLVVDLRELLTKEVSPMRPRSEQAPADLLTEQECQAKVRVRRIGVTQHAYARNWSPAVAAGLLVLSILTAVTWIVTVVLAIR